MIALVEPRVAAALVLWLLLLIASCAAYCAWDLRKRG